MGFRVCGVVRFGGKVDGRAVDMIGEPQGRGFLYSQGLRIWKDVAGAMVAGFRILRDRT